jgi:hypothetical protein
MKLLLPFLTTAVCLGLSLPPCVVGQASSPKAPPQTYIRYLCASEGNVPPKVFGEWPQFQPPRRLALETGSAGPLLLAPSFLPLSSSGYQPAPPAPGKIVVQELPVDSADKTPPKILSSLNFQPKAGRFYTLLIRGTGVETKLDLLEDEPAVLPASKEGEDAPPPRRSLRCLVLEPGARAKISCPEAGVRLEAISDKPILAENLKRGIWSLTLEGDNKGTPISTTVEIDLESPGNWTLFLMRDIYGRLAPTLKKDAALD